MYIAVRLEPRWELLMHVYGDMVAGPDSGDIFEVEGGSDSTSLYLSARVMSAEKAILCSLGLRRVVSDW